MSLLDRINTDEKRGNGISLKLNKAKATSDRKRSSAVFRGLSASFTSSTLQPEKSIFAKMSLLPFMFADDFPVVPRRLLDQDFGLALTPDDLLSATVGPMMRSRDYYRPWRQLAAAARDLGSSIKSDKDKFQVNLDVQHFAPEEISVKTADGYVVVEGKHEEKQDEHGFISRQFVRRYALPNGCRPEMVESKLSSDGVLTVTAPKHHAAIKGERPVQIQQTGPVRKEIKDESQQEAKK